MALQQRHEFARRRQKMSFDVGVAACGGTAAPPSAAAFGRRAGDPPTDAEIRAQTREDVVWRRSVRRSCGSYVSWLDAAAAARGTPCRAYRQIGVHRRASVANNAAVQIVAESGATMRRQRGHDGAWPSRQMRRARACPSYRMAIQHGRYQVSHVRTCADGVVSGVYN